MILNNVAIPTDAIERIIEAGVKAPANDHMRDWHYVVIQDKNVVMQLLDIIPKGISEEDINQLIMDWNLSDKEQQETYRNAVPKQHKMLLDASVVVIPLLKQKTDILHSDNISHLNGFASIWCSVENIFLAATAEGCACTLRGSLGNEGEWARDVLGYPEDYFMPCFIGIGNSRYAAELFCIEYNETAKAFSIQDDNVIEAIKGDEMLVFAYPVQYSTVSKMLRDFIYENKELWMNKKVFVITTMGLFSGDGAGVLGRLLQQCGAEIIGGLHLKMPDSIGDEKVLKRPLEKNKELVKKAEQKIGKSVRLLKAEKTTQEGSGVLFRMAVFFG